MKVHTEIIGGGNAYTFNGFLHTLTDLIAKYEAEFEELAHTENGNAPSVSVFCLLFGITGVMIISKFGQRTTQTERKRHKWRKRRLTYTPECQPLCRSMATAWKHRKNGCGGIANITIWKSPVYTPTRENLAQQSWAESSFSKCSMI